MSPGSTRDLWSLDLSKERRGSTCVWVRTCEKERSRARKCVRETESDERAREIDTEGEEESVYVCICKRAYTRVCTDKDIYQCIHETENMCLCTLTHHLIPKVPRHIVAPNRPLRQRVYGYVLHFLAVIRVSEGVRPMIEARIANYLACVAVARIAHYLACVAALFVWDFGRLSAGECNFSKLKLASRRGEDTRCGTGSAFDFGAVGVSVTLACQSHSYVVQVLTRLPTVYSRVSWVMLFFLKETSAVESLMLR